ncbi:G patch domain and ankyrin repeat-containing protein 1 homolog [Epargyreus clarus]|uniref:G patch domain and ankyrin repeat-containing protein 1 homolog n=1 Tax=Epargyreus clarus TaxID=520877 RepID=UPI003C2B531B
MFHKEYSNFVRPSSPQPQLHPKFNHKLNGEEAKRLYLEEVKDVKTTTSSPTLAEVPPEIHEHTTKRKRKLEENDTSNSSLFLSVQNNDVSTLKEVLDSCPDKINLVDEFGWSLLMIACQANSIEAVKELLKRGIDTSVRDKAGNSARSLVIKNKNVLLADILLNINHYETKTDTITPKVRLKEEYSCQTCNKVFPDKQEHLSSTVHNINASKGKKIPSSYKIPESNRGYQIMLKVGWDKESGLGRDGSGKLYPVKAVQKLDRKGLGLQKNNPNSREEDSIKTINKKKLKRDYHENRRFEANFRREFY